MIKCKSKKINKSVFEDEDKQITVGWDLSEKQKEILACRELRVKSGK